MSGIQEVAGALSHGGLARGVWVLLAVDGAQSCGVLEFSGERGGKGFRAAFCEKAQTPGRDLGREWRVGGAQAKTRCRALQGRD